jgi:hypothetical protein
MRADVWAGVVVAPCGGEVWEREKWPWQSVGLLHRRIRAASVVPTEPYSEGVISVNCVATDLELPVSAFMWSVVVENE